MKKKKPIRIGSLVKNLTTGEIGVIVDVIGDKNDPFGYIVKIPEGTRRWILRKKRVPNSKPS